MLEQQGLYSRSGPHSGPVTITRLKQVLLAGTFAAVAPLAACSIDVRDEELGGRKDVDIRTPVGGMSVRTGIAAETGLAVYPGARPLREDGDPESADVSIGSGRFGLKVIAAKSESDADPGAVLGFYKEQMRSYGEVTECQGEIDFQGGLRSHRPVCKRRSSSRETQLVVGTEERHRLVSVKRRGGGSEFAVIYIQTRS
jgi:hypothetical protein